MLDKLLNQTNLVPFPYSLPTATPENFNYEQGKTYTYAYETTTKLNLDGDDGPVIRVQAKADISVLEPCELALKVSK